MHNNEPFDIAPLFRSLLKLQHEESLNEMEKMLSLHDNNKAIQLAIQSIREERLSRA